MAFLQEITSWGTAAPMLVVTALCLIFLTQLGKFIYNIYFHPLSSYSGPKLWAGSRLFLFRRSFRGELIYETKRLHVKYGPVVRIAPTELSYISASALKTIYGHRSVEMTKALDGRGGLPPPPNGGYNIVTANRSNHTRIRRNVSHAFSEQALRDQESLIQEHVTELISALRRVINEGGAQDICKWYNFATFDIVSHVAFGESLDCLKNGEYHPWITSVMALISFMPYAHFSRYYELGKFMQRLITPSSLSKGRKENFNFGAMKMKARLAIDDDRKDFTTYMLRHQDNEKGLTMDELQTMGSTLINAGSETTASAMTGMSFSLCNNSSVYEKLTKEIRNKFRTEDEITLLAASELKYLTAVLEETLRLYPPLPAALPRVVPGDGEVIDGKWVPGNTAVGVPHYAAFRSAANFHRAGEFVPERWLAEVDGGSPEFKNDNRAVFQPFSFGPRNCLGRNLAYADMRLIVARLFFNFDLELDSSSRSWERKRRAPFVWDRTPMMVRLKQR